MWHFANRDEGNMKIYVAGPRFNLPEEYIEAVQDTQRSRAHLSDMFINEKHGNAFHTEMHSMSRFKLKFCLGVQAMAQVRHSIPEKTIGGEEAVMD